MSDVVVGIVAMLVIFAIGVRVGVSMTRADVLMKQSIVEDSEAALIEDAADQAIDVDDWSNDTPWLETQS